MKRALIHYLFYRPKSLDICDHLKLKKNDFFDFFLNFKIQRSQISQNILRKRKSLIRNGQTKFFWNIR